MPYAPPPSLAGLGLAEIAELAAADRLPPVETWQPAHVGDSAMRIAADGRWYHEGGEIRRPAMIRAFARLLRRDADGSHWLVTPVEKLAIEVEDAPLIAVEQKVEGEGPSARRAFRLNTDALVLAGPDAPLVWAAGREPLAYLRLPAGLLARPSRPLWNELAEEALAQAGPGLWSDGCFFRFAEAA